MTSREKCLSGKGSIPITGRGMEHWSLDTVWGWDQGGGKGPIMPLKNLSKYFNLYSESNQKLLSDLKKKQNTKWLLAEKQHNQIRVLKRLVFWVPSRKSKRKGRSRIENLIFPDLIVMLEVVSNKYGKVEESASCISPQITSGWDAFLERVREKTNTGQYHLIKSVLATQLV